MKPLQRLLSLGLLTAAALAMPIAACAGEDQVPRDQAPVMSQEGPGEWRERDGGKSRRFHDDGPGSDMAPPNMPPEVFEKVRAMREATDRVHKKLRGFSEEVERLQKSKNEVPEGEDKLPADRQARRAKIRELRAEMTELQKVELVDRFKAEAPALADKIEEGMKKFEENAVRPDGQPLDPQRMAPIKERMSLVCDVLRKNAAKEGLTFDELAAEMEALKEMPRGSGAHGSFAPKVDEKRSGELEKEIGALKQRLNSLERELGAVRGGMPPEENGQDRPQGRNWKRENRGEPMVDPNKVPPMQGEGTPMEGGDAPPLPPLPPE